MQWSVSVETKKPAVLRFVHEKCRVKTVCGYLDLEYSCVDTKIYVFLLIIVQCVKKIQTLCSGLITP